MTKSKGMQLYQHETRIYVTVPGSQICQSKMSVFLAVIAGYSHCFVRILPANGFLALFIAMLYFVSILLRLFIAIPCPTCMQMANFRTVLPAAIVD